MSDIGATDVLNNDPCDRASSGAGKVEFHLQATDCRSVVDEITAALRPLAVTKGLSFEVVMPDSDVVVRTDRRALSQIIHDLARNAIKFTDCGMVGITIDRVQHDGRKYTQFHVVDTGIGILPEHQVELSPAIGKGQDGTESNLQRCQRLAELLGGELTVRSAPGKGSTFTFVLSHQEE
jgi:two-component system, sensor histidine kinase and response regulator